MSAALLNSYMAYLKVERSMALHTQEAYRHDVHLLLNYLQEAHPAKPVDQISITELQGFVEHLHQVWELAPYSQARVVSGIRSFYKFLALEGVVEESPAELLELPRRKQTLPETLSPDEVALLMAAVPLDTPEGHRNRAMLEAAYSSGLRATELVGIQLSNLYLEAGYIRVLGKGSKERLVPIGGEAAKHILIYQKEIRPHQKMQEKSRDVLFLNRLGNGLSRVMFFNIVKQTALQAGISKNVHPHTLRHSFATHLVMAGADLRAVQQMLGHSKITTTELYLHLDTQYLQDTMRKHHPRY